MVVEEKKVILRKLVASQGKVIISKTVNEDNQKPTVIAKEIYLAEGANEDDYEEADENLYKQ